MEGRVEVCTSYYSRWGTVCNKQWSPSHTRVVCRQLGYSDTEGIANDYVKRNCVTYTDTQVHMRDHIHLVRP